MDDAAACPCGSGESYGACCGPFHAGGDAPTALALMRSRYSAFALLLPEYLTRTWHPSTRRSVGLDDDTVWRKLQIVDTTGGGVDDEEGVVEFRASFRDPDGGGLQHERSRFVRDDGRWTYIDGEQFRR